MYDPRLETFLCVADNGSFNKAAEVLYISPPAVIKQINGLEKSLGFSLFLRTHRGLFLTAAGASLAEDARYVIQYSKDSIVRAGGPWSRARDHPHRVFAHDAGPGPCGFDASVAGLDQRIKFQVIPFENTPENAREILSHLGRNIDVVAGIFDETMLRLRRCQGFELKRTPLCCALSLHHPLARKDFLTVEDLHGEALMLIREGWNHYVDELRHDLMDGHPEIN